MSDNKMEKLASKIFSYSGHSSQRYIQEICDSLSLVGR